MNISVRRIDGGLAGTTPQVPGRRWGVEHVVDLLWGAWADIREVARCFGFGLVVLTHRFICAIWMMPDTRFMISAVMGADTRCCAVRGKLDL